MDKNLLVRVIGPHMPYTCVYTCMCKYLISDELDDNLGYQSLVRLKMRKFYNIP